MAAWNPLNKVRVRLVEIVQISWLVERKDSRAVIVVSALPVGIFPVDWLQQVRKCWEVDSPIEELVKAAISLETMIASMKKSGASLMIYPKRRGTELTVSVSIKR